MTDHARLETIVGCVDIAQRPRRCVDRAQLSSSSEAFRSAHRHFTRILNARGETERPMTLFGPRNSSSYEYVEMTCPICSLRMLRLKRDDCVR